MSSSISTLLTRNLHDVFGENDPARRRAAIEEIFTEDCVFYEPKGAYRGRVEASQQLNVSLPERPHLLPVDNDRSDQLGVLEHGHEQNGPNVTQLYAGHRIRILCSAERSAT